MPLVLTLTPGSNVSCGHGTTSSVATTSTARLRVNGLAVLTKPSVVSKAIANCATVPSADATGPINVTCTLVTKVTAGESTKLTVSGNPVLLDTLQGDTNGMVAKITPQLLLNGIAAQTKLTAS